MEGKWLGPIKIDKFKSNFGPKSDDTKRSLRKKKIPFKDIETTVKGKEAFVKVINDSNVLEGRNLWCKDTHSIYGLDTTTDADHALKFSPDVSFMISHHLQMKTGNEERLERLLGDILFFGDLKGSNSQDPCLHITSDDDRALLGDFLEELGNDLEESFLTRGQFACYARAICANSHRTHLQAFVILPQYARLLYFDRSGVAFSELFDWRKTSHLSDLIQSFAEAPPLERGIDTSVTKIALKDPLVDKARVIFTEARKRDDVLPDDVTWESVFESVENELTTYWLCNVYDEKSKSFHRIVTYRVNTSSPYFIGRATRGYIGVDTDEGIVAYMKRSWRIADDALPKERDIYLQFDVPGKGGKRVPHLPGCYFGGDVPRNSDTLSAQYFEWKAKAKPGDSWTPPESIELFRTKTADYADNKADVEYIRRGASALERASLTDADIEMTPYILTVTLFKKIGSKLRDFKSTRQLCIAIRDAIETHEAAYFLKDVLHRDISEGNILIAKVQGKPGEVEGLLIDWDLCIEIKRFTDARRKSRTGTWAFMSSRMLEHPKGFVHDVFDDLESFCHVFHWHILRFRYTTGLRPGARGELWDAMGRIFNPDEQSLTAEGAANFKSDLLRGSIKVISTARSAIQPKHAGSIMLKLCQLFKEYYALPPEAPDVFDQDDPDIMADYNEKVVEHEGRVAQAYSKCTHAAMLGVLNAKINASASWENDGPAQDQYPSYIRKARKQEKDIDAFYKETETGVSISGPSEVGKALSKRLFPESESEELLDSRFYARGSDRRSAVSSGATAATAVSQTPNGARKRQRKD